MGSLVGSPSLRKTPQCACDQLFPHVRLAWESGAAAQTSWNFICWQACSNSAWNSEPPSTCIAFILKGMRFFRLSRKPAAVFAVALVCTSSTSQREITSLAVNCLMITPGSGRMSRVVYLYQVPRRSLAGTPWACQWHRAWAYSVCGLRLHFALALLRGSWP